MAHPLSLEILIKDLFFSYLELQLFPFVHDKWKITINLYFLSVYLLCWFLPLHKRKGVDFGVYTSEWPADQFRVTLWLPARRSFDMYVSYLGKHAGKKLKRLELTYFYHDLNLNEVYCESWHLISQQVLHQNELKSHIWTTYRSDSNMLVTSMQSSFKWLRVYDVLFLNYNTELLGT